ncbi:MULTISPECIES: DUF2848 domain-containing protein [Burkholderia cepacia complex]|uniref:DUF2848 domain-containing protein n=1 Tax=Burkholderia cepacia complex TaxID=87882 RepID=UPI0009824870|nr:MULTISPECIES: DUF2848 domain-containing protein [Burkholderia cepacia complex]AQQ30316.1 hypothetical protein A8E88_34195 [Burkholderia cenocepacia]MBK1818830.1 DUF2848 domain-containing protein [Burkholderia orbicola]ONV88480.1 hypothetical protein A8E89_19575 [Burkholderia cenocepacia]ONW08014.1 hypothetical protein A8E90_30680 [Burkholderia cenocepacia]ONW12804.1 hypothetical protein A8E94_17435 [Burkholderia cenocepacia]
MPILSFNVISLHGAPAAVDVDIERVVIAGWAGRDPDAIQAHIDELAALGVAPPSTTPCFYRVSSALITQAPSIGVLGARSGGEIECVLIDSPAGTLVTIGSDHTDREVEAYGVAVSKQVCAKPLGRDAWRHADVADHWDTLELRSWLIARDGERRAYQHGAVSGLLAPDALWHRFDDRRTMPARCAMYGGTVAVHGAIAAMGDGDAFEMELHDPVLGRSLTHRYAVEVLPIVA